MKRTLTSLRELTSVVLFCLCRYDNKLKEARALGVKKALTVGSGLALIFFLIFFVNAAGFW